MWIYIIDTFVDRLSLYLVSRMSLNCIPLRKIFVHKMNDFNFQRDVGIRRTLISLFLILFFFFSFYFRMKFAVSIFFCRYVFTKMNKLHTRTHQNDHQWAQNEEGLIRGMSTFSLISVNFKNKITKTKSAKIDTFRFVGIT